jgi:hypothetical protein
LHGSNQVAWGDCVQYDGPAYDEPVYSPPPPPVYSPPPPAYSPPPPPPINLTWPIYLVCQPASDQLGTRQYNDGGVVTSFIEVNTGVFKVGYRLSNGQAVFRQQQYAMTEGPIIGVNTQWHGYRVTNPKLTMEGTIYHDENDQAHFTYDEKMWDAGRDGQMILHTQAYCLRVYDFASGAQYPRTAYYTPPAAPTYTPHPYVPTPAPNYAPPSPVGRDSVGLAYDRGGVYVMVGMGSSMERMQLDTGASSSLVPQDVADRLLRLGEAHIVGSGTVTLADGRTVDETVIMIDRVSVGSHVLTNVKAGVTPGGSALLGLDVLSAIGKFQVDMAAGVLIFG